RQDRRERAALEVLRDDEGPAVAQNAEIERGGHVRVVERGGRRRDAPHFLTGLVRTGEPAQQDAHGDRSIEREVVGAIADAEGRVLGYLFREVAVREHSPAQLIDGRKVCDLYRFGDALLIRGDRVWYLVHPG